MGSSQRGRQSVGCADAAVVPEAALVVAPRSCLHLHAILPHVSPW